MEILKKNIRMHHFWEIANIIVKTKSLFLFFSFMWTTYKTEDYNVRENRKFHGIQFGKMTI